MVKAVFGAATCRPGLRTWFDTQMLVLHTDAEEQDRTKPDTPAAPTMLNRENPFPNSPNPFPTPNAERLTRPNPISYRPHRGQRMGHITPACGTQHDSDEESKVMQTSARPRQVHAN